MICNVYTQGSPYTVWQLFISLIDQQEAIVTRATVGVVTVVLTTITDHHRVTTGVARVEMIVTSGSVVLEMIDSKVGVVSYHHHKPVPLIAVASLTLFFLHELIEIIIWCVEKKSSRLVTHHCETLASLFAKIIWNSCRSNNDGSGRAWLGSSFRNTLLVFPTVGTQMAKKYFCLSYPLSCKYPSKLSADISFISVCKLLIFRQRRWRSIQTGWRWPV